MIKPLLVCVFLLFAGSVFAEEASESRQGVLSGASKTSLFRGTGGTSAQGIRIGFFQPVYRMRAIVEGPFGKQSNSESLDDDDYGLTAGYVSYPVRALGFDGLISYSKLMESRSGDELFQGRIAANIGYAFNSFVYVKGGLNVSQWFGDIDEKPDPGLGGQVGVGLQGSENIGLTLDWVMMRVTDEELGLSAEIQTIGMELGLAATF